MGCRRVGFFTRGHLSRALFLLPLCGVLVLCLTSTVSSGRTLANLVSGLSDSDVSRLRAGSELMREASSVKGLQYLPASYEGTVLAAELAASKGSIYETAFLIPGVELSPSTKLSVYNAITSVEGLKGLTYYSGFRGRDTVLFDTVYKTPGPGSMRRLADEAAQNLPGRSRFDFYAHDVNMGSCWYRVDVDSAGNGLLVSVTNTRALNVFVFHAFNPETFQLRFILLGTDEGIYVYGLCSARVAPSLAAMVDTREIVGTRLDAIRRWSSSRIIATRLVASK